MRIIDAYRAIDMIDEWLDSVGTVLVGKGLSSYGELIGCIEDTPTLTPPNEPLTLKQLRKMDGEPVYVSVSGMEISTMWALIEYIPESRSIVLTNNLGGRSEYFDDDDIKSDGITIYRRPLTKMEANENG